MKTGRERLEGSAAVPLRFGEPTEVPLVDVPAESAALAAGLRNEVSHRGSPVAPDGIPEAGSVLALDEPARGAHGEGARPAGGDPRLRDWRRALPVLAGGRGLVRDLRLSDAPSLFAMLTPSEVARFVSPPPATVEGFERFIAWSHRRREEGTCLGFGVVAHGMDDAVGLIQVRQLDPAWSTAEWGFAVGSAFWGTGLFVECARLVVDFVFEALQVHRLEARASVRNGRGNGVLAKLGAVREGVLRQAFFRDGRYTDQILWAILQEEWVRSKAVWNERIH